MVDLKLTVIQGGIKSDSEINREIEELFNLSGDELIARISENHGDVEAFHKEAKAIFERAFSAHANKFPRPPTSVILFSKKEGPV